MNRSAESGGRTLLLRDARLQARLSAREAADKLEISTAYLSALELGHKRLRDEHRGRCMLMYGLSPDIYLVQPLPADTGNLLEWMRQHVKWWDSRFVLPSIPAATRMNADLYVDPEFQTPAGTIVHSTDALTDFLSDAGNRALLISGSIGSGKSFFLKALTLNAAPFREKGSDSSAYVPLLVSMGEFRIMPGSPVNSIVEYYLRVGYDGPRAPMERFLRQCIERGQALFLFDGLDELPTPYEQARALAYFEQIFVDVLRPAGNKLIITGRPDSLATCGPDSDIFIRYELCPWQPEQVRTGVLRWSWQDQEQAQHFWSMLQVNGALYDLARTPLLFHLLTTLYSTRGLLPFQDLAGLYSACCQTLENSWTYSRRLFTAPDDPHRNLQSFPEGYSWLHWRKFLIFLMEQQLNAYYHAGEPVSLEFDAQTVYQAWGAFLAENGIEKHGFEYTRLEGLLPSQEAIGPMFHERETDARGRERVRYAFLSPDFGRFYLALALIDEPERLRSIVLRSARDKFWEPVLALAIQLLGRSERKAEQRFSHELIQLLLSVDDELKLEHQHGVGKFGLLTAMNAVGSYTIDTYWQSVVQPFVAELEAQDEYTCRQCWLILGRHCASPALRRYVYQTYDELKVKLRHGQVSEFDRVLTFALLACIGERLDAVINEYEAELRDFITNGEESVAEKRVNARRLLWRLPLIGRAFMLDQQGVDQLPHYESLMQFRTTLSELADYLAQHLDVTLSSRQFNNQPYWHLLAMILRCGRELNYQDCYTHSVKTLLQCMDTHFEVLVTEYPYRRQALQFLKAATSDVTCVPETVTSSLIRRMHALQSDPGDLHMLDIECVISQISVGAAGKPPYEVCTESDVRTWISVLESSRDQPCENVCDLGWAVCSIGEHLERSMYALPGITDSALASLLLACFKTEKRIRDLAEREEYRCFTLPFSDYCFPLYDHLYNTLCVVARRLRLDTETGEREAGDESSR